MENDAVLRYFQSSYANVMKLKSENNEILDYYSTIILIDSIERVFLNGRNGKLFGSTNGFEVFDSCCGNDFKGDKELYEFCKYLRRSKFDVNVKSKCFIGYALRNNKFVDFIVDLLKNEDIIVDMFDRTAFFRSPSLMSKFIEHLIELENLNFLNVIDNYGFVIEDNNNSNNDIIAFNNAKQKENSNVENTEPKEVTSQHPSIVNNEKYNSKEIEPSVIFDNESNVVIHKKPSSMKKKRKVKNRVISLD